MKVIIYKRNMWPLCNKNKLHLFILHSADEEQLRKNNASCQDLSQRKGGDCAIFLEINTQSERKTEYSPEAADAIDRLEVKVS